MTMNFQERNTTFFITQVKFLIKHPKYATTPHNKITTIVRS